jgi:hypothetical protein
MTIISEIADAIVRLRASASINVTHSQAELVPDWIARPAEQGQMINETCGIQCPPTVLASLQIDDDLSCHWKSKNRTPDETVAGEIFLRSVLLFGGTNELSETYLSQDHELIDLRSTRVFDYCPYQGGPIYALLPVTERQLQDHVFIFNQRKVFRSTLDYTEYLRAVRLTRGFLYWQYLYCEALRPEEYERVAIERGLAFIEAEFPADDYADLRRRLQQLG